jgi:acetolactate synthase-1/2/3 large subunit
MSSAVVRLVTPQLAAQPSAKRPLSVVPAAQSAPAPTPKNRAVDVCLKYLKAEGVKFVFGVAGGLLYPFFAAVEADESLEFIGSKHEEGAAFMADGVARVGGGLAVCAGTSGPGSTNLLTGVACAFSDGVPMIVITGQAASFSLGKGAAQETPRDGIDIVEMFRPVTKYSVMVTSAEMLAHHLRQALRMALTGRPGPVHLNVPVDMWEKAVDDERWFDPKTYRPESFAFDRASVREGARILYEAKYPVFLVGSGVGSSRAEPEVAALANLLGARVATTPRAKGLFPENDPLALGVLGVAGHREARETIFSEDVDVLFTIGASLGETSTMNWNPLLRPSRALIQLDIDPVRIGRNYPVDLALVGDARAIVAELAVEVRAMLGERKPRGSQWDDPPPSFRASNRYDDPDARTSDAVPVTPQRWRADLQEVLPEDAIVFSDIGGHMLFNIHELCITERQKFVINMGFGSMGHGIIAPIGAALAQPHRQVFAITGDGCFMMNGMDLITAAEREIPVIWIVENNNMQAITWYCSQQLNGGRGMEAARYRKPVDIARMAEAMGLPAYVVEAPGHLKRVVQEAMQRKGPTVIDVRVDVSVPPPLGARAKSLAGFIRK